MKLSLQTGRLPNELLSELNSRDISEFMAYDDIEPFGEQRADLRSAIVAATVANSQRTRRSRSAKPVEFMPFVEKQRKNPMQLLNAFRAAIVGVGAKK